MIASDKTVDQIREHIGATSLAYLSHEGLVAATRRPATELTVDKPGIRLSLKGHHDHA